ncbi:chemotaxis protein CheW [Candidatus Pacearchaeota archaeon]|nr:chemotaxis protein CheW [Candidatus Pacearchaeota archaeon]
MTESPESYCIFRINDQSYGIPLNDVQRVIRAVDITSLPEGPESILGIINVNGQMLPVLNIRKIFHLKEKDISVHDRIILFQAKILICFVVDSVDGVATFTDSQFQQSTQIHPLLEQYVLGVAAFELKNILIIDLNRFINEQELRSFKEITKDHKLEQ